MTRKPGDPYDFRFVYPPLPPDWTVYRITDHSALPKKKKRRRKKPE
jgi:hypothetical protein